MKYYHTFFDFEGKQYDRGYNIDNLPLNTPIYGFAYDINDDTEHHNLICKPILGEIIDNGRRYNRFHFVPYKKGTTEKRSSGSVQLESRMYADTYEEAVEMYNELVDKRIS